MEAIYIKNKTKFISQYGRDKFEKLYQKVGNSKAITSLIGNTVNLRIPPNAADILGSANTITYVILKFSIGTSVMAGLITLKIWNERVNMNMNYELNSKERLHEIAEKISVRWI